MIRIRQVIVIIGTFLQKSPLLSKSIVFFAVALLGFSNLSYADVVYKYKITHEDAIKKCEKEINDGNGGTTTKNLKTRIKVYHKGVEDGFAKLRIKFDLCIQYFGTRAISKRINIRLPLASISDNPASLVGKKNTYQEVDHKDRDVLVTIENLDPMTTDDGATWYPVKISWAEVKSGDVTRYPVTFYLEEGQNDYRLPNIPYIEVEHFSSTANAHFLFPAHFKMLQEE